MNNKKSKNIYNILMLSAGYVIFSFSKFDFKGFENTDLWLLIFIITINLSTTIFISDLALLRMHRSPEIVSYKMKINNLFKKHEDNLEYVREKWKKNTIKDFANNNIHELYYVARKMNIQN